MYLWFNKRERLIINRKHKMFKKLLSNLPFNPSLIQQVSFYAKRMRSETKIRRLGLGFMALALFVNVYAANSPTEQSFARAGNDIIPGGFTSKNEAVNWCTSNLEIKTIFAHFGVSCEAVASSRVTTVNSRGHNSQLYSLGRLPYGKAGETAIPIGEQTFYLRYLWSWDSRSSGSSYQALAGTRDNGAPFYLLFNCGNIVTIGVPTPPPPPPPPQTPPPTPPKVPNLELHKKARNITQSTADANGTTARPGDIIEYTLTTKNTGDGVKEKYVVSENMTDVLEYASLNDFGGGELTANNLLRWPAADIAPGETITLKVRVKVKDPLPQTPSPVSNPGSFDMVMTNVYGDTIQIKLPPSVPKATEQVTQTLPNTGPGTTLAVGFGLMAFIGYFYARSRLFATELDIVREDFVSSGGN